MKQTIFLSVVIIFLIIIPFFFIHQTNLAVNKYNHKVQQFTEVGSVKKITTEYYKGGIFVDYWFDVPKGERYIDNANVVGFREGDSVIVEWSIREDGSYIVDNFNLKK